MFPNSIGFLYLLKSGNIRISHAILLLNELKQQAYYKWHNSYSQATNDCNVFRQQIQPALSERRLRPSEMKNHKQLFPINTLDLSNVKVLVQPDQAKYTKAENDIIGEERPQRVYDIASSREGVLETTHDGRESLKIIVKASRLTKDLQTNQTVQDRQNELS